MVSNIRLFLLLLCLALFGSMFDALPLKAQSFSASSIFQPTVRGEIVGLKHTQPQTLFVEVKDAAGMRPSQRVPVNPNGTFDLRLAQGDLVELRIVDPAGNVLKRELVDTTGGGSLSIRIEEPEQERPVAGVISARRLAHKVPARAQKLFVKAAHASEKGRPEEATDHLRKAVEIDPEFFEALNNLGVRMMQEKRYDEAAAYFERALKVDPGASKTLINYGVALIQLRKPEQAEFAAREAMRMENTPQAQYLLGVSLLSQGKPLDPHTAEVMRSFARQR